MRSHIIIRFDEMKPGLMDLITQNNKKFRESEYTPLQNNA